MQSTVSSNIYILSASSWMAPCSAFFTREQSIAQAVTSFLNLRICKVVLGTGSAGNGYIIMYDKFVLADFSFIIRLCIVTV